MRGEGRMFGTRRSNGRLNSRPFRVILGRRASSPVAGWRAVRRLRGGVPDSCWFGGSEVRVVDGENTPSALAVGGMAGRRIPGGIVGEFGV